MFVTTKVETLEATTRNAMKSIEELTTPQIIPDVDHK